MTGASLKPPVDSQQSAMNGNTNDAALDGDDVKLHDSFAQGFRVGAEPATLQERRVSWGNLLWSDFTGSSPTWRQFPSRNQKVDNVNEQRLLRRSNQFPTGRSYREHEGN